MRKGTQPRKLLFLDFDGVLNDHKPHANGYCGLCVHSVAALSHILEQCPDVDVVVSSAWRYLVADEVISLRGLEYVLCMHGAPFDTVNGRLIAITDTDETTAYRYGIMETEDAELDYEWLKEHGLALRVLQVENFAFEVECAHYVVLDDLALETDRLQQTDGARGLTVDDAREVIARFA